MALFRKKTERGDVPTPATPKVAPSKTAPKANTPALNRNLAAVLVKPRLTEKAVADSERNVYTFVVSKTASKRDIVDAVRAFYQVTPRKVNTSKSDPRRYRSRVKGRVVREAGLKKAYVYLKPGDSITLV